MSKFYMAGTEGTGEYIVVVVTPLGRVGYRAIGSKSYRIRVEPTNDATAETLAPAFTGWKQPGDGGQFRFSTVVPDGASATDAVKTAVVALLGKTGEGEVGHSAFLTRFLVEEQQERIRLVNMVRKAGLPGANGASRWTTEVLRKKAAPFVAEEYRQALIAEVKGKKLPGSNSAGSWSTIALERNLRKARRAGRTAS